MPKLDEIRRDMESFFSESAQETYLHASGLKTESNQSPIYEKYKYLFTKELVSEIKDMRKISSGEEERKLRYLQSTLTIEYLLNKLKGLFDDLDTRQSRKMMKVGNEDIPYRQLALRIENEADRAVRAKIHRAYGQALEDFNPALRDIVLGLREASRELGYEDYVTLYRDIHGIDLDKLQLIIEKFSVETDSLYFDEMSSAVSEKLDMRLEDVEPHDMWRFYRAMEFDQYFSKERLLPTLMETLANMGIDLAKQKNIHLDLEERPNKIYKGFFIGIKIPEDIRLLVKSVGGYQDYGAVFHEVGHGLHTGFVDPSLDFEYKWLGDKSLCEGYATLFDRLIFDAKWLRRYLKIEDTKRYLDFQFLGQLDSLRGYASLISYEIRLHTQGPDGMDEVYQTIFERAFGTWRKASGTNAGISRPRSRRSR